MTAAPPPDPRLRAVVTVPARDEQERIGACLRALAGQRGLEPGAFEVVLVLDHCADATHQYALAAAAELPRLALITLESDLPGAGHARRIGMDLACERLLAAGRPDGLIASTDADSRVAADWLAVQLELAAQGARAIGGRIELDPLEASRLPAAVLEGRANQARIRLDRVRSRAAPAAAPASGRGREATGPAGERSAPAPGPGRGGEATGLAGERSAPRDPSSAGHPHFGGASLAVTARAYREVGGLPLGEALEDEALQRALEDAGIPIVRNDRVRVTTSARTDGRASRGLAHDLSLADWRARRSFRAADYDAERLLEAKAGPISVILPAREEAGTIGAIIDALAPMRELGLIDEVLVIDAASRDGTAAVAAGRGASVVQQDELLSEYGPARGKGDAMWRALSVAVGRIVVYLDADTRDFRADFVVGLLGPLLTNPEIRLVKGAFRRPFRVEGRVLPGEGGRVTELVARPLLNLYAPHLAGFDQPLAGELAAYADLLRSLPFPAGYGVEVANLIDAARAVGVDALAQVDLGTRQNRHQPLRDLSGMSYAVMVAAAARLHGARLTSAPAPGQLALPPAPGATTMQTRQVTVIERPPLDSISRARPGGRAAVPRPPAAASGDQLPAVG